MDAYNYSLQSYFQDEAASPLGYTEQEQLCFISGPEKQHVCTPLLPINDIPAHTEALIQDREQLNRIIWMHNVLTSPSALLGDLLNTLHESALLARYTMSSNAQGPIASNQWQQEVQHWFATILAGVQQAFIRAAVGPSPELYEFSTKPASEQSQEMCRNQKIKSTSYASFSMFGLLFVGITGGLIIVMSYALEPMVGLMYRKGKLHGPRYLEWTTNSTLQIQRLAHSAVGAGHWSGAISPVPITKPGELLAALDMTNPEQLLLYVANSSSDSETLQPSEVVEPETSSLDSNRNSMDPHEGREDEMEAEDAADPQADSETNSEHQTSRIANEPVETPGVAR